MEGIRQELRTLDVQTVLFAPQQLLFLLVDGFTDDAGAGVWSVASLVLGDSKWRAKKHILNEKTWGICEEFDNGLRRLLAGFADTPC